MSMIDKSNIEYWLFQYHEDLLSDKDQIVLFNYLSKNPEYYEDFTLWSKTKLKVDLNLTNKPLENSLLVNIGKTKNVNHNRYLFDFTLASTITILLFLLLKKDNQSKETSSMNTLTARREEVSEPLTDKSLPTTIRPRMIFHNEHSRKKTLLDSIGINDTKPYSSKEGTLQYGEDSMALSTKTEHRLSDIHRDIGVKELTTTLKDTVENLQKTKQESPHSKTKKKRWKKRFSAAENFIEDNNDL